MYEVVDVARGDEVLVPGIVELDHVLHSDRKRAKIQKGDFLGGTCLYEHKLLTPQGVSKQNRNRKSK